MYLALVYSTVGPLLISFLFLFVLFPMFCLSHVSHLALQTQCLDAYIDVLRNGSEIVEKRLFALIQVGEEKTQ